MFWPYLVNLTSISHTTAKNKQHFQILSIFRKTCLPAFDVTEYKREQGTRVQAAGYRCHGGQNAPMKSKAS